MPEQEGSLSKLNEVFVCTRAAGICSCSE